MTDIRQAPARDPHSDASLPPSQRIALSVTSEIGRLRTVMVHRPGPEMDRMIPSMMEQMLFDDILYGDCARAEHDKFRTLLGRVADEVLDVEEMLIEALQPSSVRDALVETLTITEHLPDATVELLSSLGPAELARVAIRGIEHSHTEYARLGGVGNPYLMSPLANLFFVRDPLVNVGNCSLLCSMAHGARKREPLLLKFCYAFHPRLQLGKDRFFRFDDLVMDAMRRPMQLPGLEGGDILVLSDKIVVVGASERSSEISIDLLAQTLQRGTSIETVLMVLMPKSRSMMHLDTIFTMVSPNEALVYPPMFERDGQQLLPVVKKDLRGAHVQSEFKPSLIEALRDEGLEVETIRCGGSDVVAQQREQWTDGANAFALAPGVITLYERNVYTAQELSRHGYEVVHIDEVAQGRTRLELDGRHKYAVLLEGRELSRARGGPRCMTMPLVRDRV